MGLIYKASVILRRSCLTHGFTVSYVCRPGKTCVNPISTFTNWPGGFCGSTLFLRDFLAGKVERKQNTHIASYKQTEKITDTSERTRLYPEFDCELINQVLAVSSFEEILKFPSVVSKMNLKLASQTVVTVIELLKSACPQQNDEYLAALQHVRSSAVFQRCLEILGNEFSDLPDSALLDVFLALSHVISEDHELFTKYLLKCQELLPHFTLEDLSKFCILISKLGGKYLPLVAPVIDEVSLYIEDCKSEEDIRNLATCLESGITFASSDCIVRFAKQVEAYLSSGKDLEFITALKCLAILTIFDNELNSVDLQHSIISLLYDFVPKLNSTQIAQLCQNISYAKCNTDSIQTAIEQRLNEFLQESKNASEMILLLNCVSQHASSLKHKSFVSHCIKRHPELYDVREAFNIYLLMDTMYNMFPLQNKELSLHLIKLCCSQNLPIEMLRKIALKLVYFRKMTNYALTGENIHKFTDLCYYFAENSVKCNDIAVFSSLVITNLNENIPVKFLQRLNSILSQLSIHLLAVVSQSLSVDSLNSPSLSHAHHKALSDMRSNLLTLFMTLMPFCKNLTEYNTIFRSIASITSHPLSSGQSRDTVIHDSFFKGFSRFLNNNIRMSDIISTCKVISQYKICLPHVLDPVTQYVVERPATLSVRAVAYALKACYTVSYAPQVQGFFTKCQDTIISKHQLLSCQSLLQSALCLGLNGVLKDQMIHLIFCKEFLDRLEKEIIVCSISQAKTIRLAFAQLNKIICLDYPEKNVPWLHEQFCKTQILKENSYLSKFEKEVYKVLCEILPRKELIKVKVYTPYYYLISFELPLHQSNSPVEDGKQNTSSSEIQRVAVDVLPEREYCRNMPQLTGSAFLKKKHLETLGYKLIQVPYFEWNSLHLTNNKSRADYLYTKIFQST